MLRVIPGFPGHIGHPGNPRRPVNEQPEVVAATEKPNLPQCGQVNCEHNTGREQCLITAQFEEDSGCGNFSPV